MIDLEIIKTLREETGAGVMETKRALEEADGDIQKAKKLLKESGQARAAKKAEREVKAGLVESYIHTNGRVGSLVEVLCETDFVARTKDFVKLAHELALQAAGLEAETVDEFLQEPYIRDESKTVRDVVNEVIAKTGENIKVGRICRFKI